MADPHTSRILLDSDGTLTLGPPSATGKLAPIRTGTRRFLESLKKRGFEIVIHTAYQPLGAVTQHYRQAGLLPLISEITNEKLPAKIQVDDRAIGFQGSYADTLKQIDTFRPHWEIGTKKKYSCVMAPMPEEVRAEMRKLAGLLWDDDLDPEDGRENDFHLTLKFGIESDSPDGARRALAETSVIRAKLLKLSLFKLPGKEVLKFDVESLDAVAVNEAICKECPHVDTYASYIPHVTVGYLKPGKGEEYVKPTPLDGKEILLPVVQFADRNKNTETITLRPRGEAAAK